MARRSLLDVPSHVPAPEHSLETPDFFADTRMPFGEHLEVLRKHLWKAVLGFVVTLALVFGCDFAGYATGTRLGIGRPVMAFIARPVEQELQNFYRRRVQKVLANLGSDASLSKVNQPTEFFRVGLLRKQILAILQGQSPAQVDAVPRPQPGTPATTEVADNEIYHLWIRAEEPLREAAYRQEAERQVGRRPVLATMGMMEGMMVYLQVAMACSFMLACPWIFWQAWSFVAAGLYPQERQPVLRYLPLSVALMAAGVLVCQLWVIPKAVETLLGFNEWLDLEPELRLREWLGFAVWMPLCFGLSFETPLVMLLLERVGVFTVDNYRSKRRLAWFIMLALAGVVTPPFDIMSMLFLWAVLGILYELGIVCCARSASRLE